MRGQPVALEALAAADPSLRIVGDPATPVRGLSLDVRDVEPGDLFAALDGDPFRGHGVAAEALRRGAAALLVAREVGPSAPALVGTDPRAAIARIAAAFHGHPSRGLGVVGITGTDGKTTTAHLLDTILRTAGVETGAITTVDIRVAGRARPASRLTTPESVDVQRLLREMLDAGARWAIVEATSHGLALSRLEAVEVDVAAVTNVAHEHLDFHGTPAAYRRAKGLLFERLAGGTAVANADDAGAMSLLAHARRAATLLFGLETPGAAVRGERVEVGRSGSSFVLRCPDASPVGVRLPLPGRFNVANALCAAACALACGVEPEAIAAALSAAPPLRGRLTPIDAGQPFAVVVDFAHTPEALGRVLELLRALHPGARLIAVVGSAGERDLLKRPRLGEAAATGADLSVFTSEDPRHEDAESVLAQLAAGARSTGARDGHDFVCVVDRRAAIDRALAEARPGDCVLLAGKGHERSIVWGDEERPWDEAAVARELLAERGWEAA